jgi:hypothetical protein
MAAEVDARGNGAAATSSPDPDDSGDAPGPADVEAPVSTRAGAAQLAAIGLLLAYGVALTIFADPALRYARDAAAHALDPAALIEAVRTTRPGTRSPSP